MVLIGVVGALNWTRSFQTQIWKEYSDKYLVQVLIDFPSDKTGQSDSTQKQNRAIKKYDVRGYPTIILQIVWNLLTEQDINGGPKNYINHIKDNSKAYCKRLRFTHRLKILSFLFL